LSSEIPYSEERKRQSIRAPSMKADMAEDLTQERWRRLSKDPECSWNPTAVTILLLPGKHLIAPSECLVGRGLGVTITTCRKKLFGQSRENYFPMHLYPLETHCLHGLQLSYVRNCRENRTVPQSLPVTGACAVGREWEQNFLSLCG